jgi:hypothetical protein
MEIVNLGYFIRVVEHDDLFHAASLIRQDDLCMVCGNAVILAKEIESTAVVEFLTRKHYCSFAHFPCMLKLADQIQSLEICNRIVK